jgi:hypothetical protein
VADVVGAAFAVEHLVEVAQADGAVIFKVVSQFSFFRNEINAFDIFKPVLRLDYDVWHLPGLFDNGRLLNGLK